MSERAVETLCELIAIPSVNPEDGEPRPGLGERAVADYLMRRLEAAGCEVEMVEVAPGRPNVFGRISGGAGSPFMLAGHMDTVGVAGYPGAFDPLVADGSVHGRGACDMKGGLAAFVEMADLIARRRLTPPGDIVIAGLADEEHRMIGSVAAGAMDHGCAAAIVGEPTSLAAAPCHRGEIGMRLTVRGVAAHSSRPELGVNAISHMAEVVRRLDDYPALLAAAEPHPLAGRGSYSAGVIRGGTMVSIVPDRCVLDVDRRILPGEDAASVRNEIEQLLEGLDVAIDLEIEGPTWDNPPLDTDPAEPVVQHLARAHTAVTGKSAEVVAVPYCTDGPNLRIPAVIYGPGSIDVAHSVNEHVRIDELVTATQVYLETAMRFGEQGSVPPVGGRSLRARKGSGVGGHGAAQG